MEENLDKQLDELSRKVMSSSMVEQPSINFTQGVLAQIEALKTSSATTYVPLISKKVWALIIVLIVSICCVAIFGSFNDNDWLNQLSIDSWRDYSIPNPFADIQFSQTVFYALLLFTIMVCVQIPILKHYFDKRLQL